VSNRAKAEPRGAQFELSPTGALATVALPVQREPLPRLDNSTLRRLKAEAQRLEPMLKLGKAGLSAAFIQSMNEALAKHSLVKIKFVEFKKERKELSAQLARETGSFQVMLVGNVAVFHRPQPN